MRASQGINTLSSVCVNHLYSEAHRMVSKCCTFFFLESVASWLACDIEPVNVTQM